jgi:hypothetical protein
MELNSSDTFLDQYLTGKSKKRPDLGGAPKETAPPDEDENPG